MKKIGFLILAISILTSCTSTKKVVAINNKHLKVDKIIQNANSYLGTKYKFGGTTKRGMDCSGLIYTSFKYENVILPRISKDMATKGKTIPLSKVKKGDLLFFATGSNNKISHVGLVSKIIEREVFFIHASSKRGVTTSSMNQKYYKTRFVRAKRIL